MIKIVIIKECSLNEIHIIDIECFIDNPLESSQELQLVDLANPCLAVLLQQLDPTPLPLHFAHQISMVVDEIVEQRGEYNIVVGGGVAVAVYGKVEIDGYHRVVYNPAKLMVDVTMRT